VKEEYMKRLVRLFTSPHVNRADLTAITEARWQWVARKGNLVAYNAWFQGVESRCGLVYPFPEEPIPQPPVQVKKKVGYTKPNRSKKNERKEKVINSPA
jgi:hypothetical protein